MEVEHSHTVHKLLVHVHEVAAIVEANTKPNEGSRMANDDLRVPTRPVSHYAHAQLTVACDSLQSLDRMIVRRRKDKIGIDLPPFAHFALLRNAIDSLAVALWLLQPQSSTGRIKRLLSLERNEVELAASNQRELNARGVPEWKQTQLVRIAQIAVEAGLDGWDPLSEKAKLPTTTHILRKIEVHHSTVNVTWLAMWQVASGHAHGKRWAAMSTNELSEQKGTATEYGASYTVTASYKVLAYMLYEVLGMLKLGVNRYLELSK